VNSILRKRAFICVAAAIAVIGCGGTGGGSHPSGTKGGGGTTKVGIGITLTNSTTTPPGAIEVAYLTGQGRAPGDLTAVVKRVFFDDSFGEVTNPLAPETDCPLVGFQNNVVHLDVSFTTQAAGAPSRLFTTFNLDFFDFLEETSSPGIFQTIATPSTVAEGGPFPKAYPAIVRVFPGRTTSLPIFIDDSMFTVDNTIPSNPQVQYNESQFLLSNGATSVSPIKAFLSDFVAFNLNNLSASDKATIGTQAGINSAARIFFSGDVYAVSDGSAGGSNVAALTLNPSQTIPGLLGAAGTLNGPGGTLPHAGTYSLLAVNPTDITQTLKIVAGQGIWREHSTVLSNLSSTGLNVVTFPGSNDDNMQEMVAFTQDAQNNISALYFGFIDMDSLTFNLFPAVDIVSGSVTGQLTGTLGTLFTKTGAATASPDLVHSGTFTFTAGQTLPAKFANGTFYVFRL